jgi:hypothetical protein
MRTRSLVVAGLSALLISQVLAWRAWHGRPAAQGASAAAAGAGLGELFNELEAGEFAGTLLLGGMRGLVIDLLWLRASRASEEGRFYESVALYELISKVQPRFEIVWNHMAWHMAYNIAVEMATVEEKWSWFLAGITASATGVRRNPQGERVLRDLAWMMFHKGADYPDRVESHDWRPLLEPILVHTGRSAVFAPGTDNFALAHALYRKSYDLAAHRGLHQPAFVQRMLPIALERSGDRQRQRGRYVAALMAYLDAVAEWRWVMASAEGLAAQLSPEQRRNHRESFERNEGQLRRKAAQLARQLAEDAVRGEELADRIMAREIDAARALLAAGGWRDRGRLGVRVRWYDEDPDGG